jgi:hypothetical protein
MSVRFQRLVPAAALLFAFFVSSESQATPHARDGFYLQLTTGLGVPHFAVTADDSSVSPPVHYTNSESGASIGGSLLVGAPLRPGIALGVGGLFAPVFPSGPDLTANGQPHFATDVKQDTLRLMGMAGPFVDIYPSPALGWHVQALVGYAMVSPMNDLAPGGNGAATGIGLMAGVGNDSWISEHWSVGVLARVSYANTHDDAVRNSESEHDTVVWPSVEVSFTFH